MSPNRSLRRAFPVFLLLVALLFTSLPVHAAPARRDVAALGEEAIAWIHELLAGLWGRGLAKEGTSIDPNGQPKEGMSIDPDGQGNDEGVTIDPNGSH